MRRTGALIGLTLLTLLAAGPAAAESLATALSSHRVLITSNYTGTAVAVFGAVERDAQTVSRGAGYDLVVTVKGPRQSLAVLASRPLAEITSPTLRRRQRIGLHALLFAEDFTYDRGGADEPFRDALLRLKRREGLYLEQERGVTFLTPSLFRASIPLPATAPPGNYDVEVVLLADTVILARTQTSFEMVKIGFEQQVGEMARDLAPLYGGATALLALFFGYVASIIFRRD
jgi:hypothetical protein